MLMQHKPSHRQHWPYSFIFAVPSLDCVMIYSACIEFIVFISHVDNYVKTE